MAPYTVYSQIHASHRYLSTTLTKGLSGNTSSSFYLWSERLGGEGVETSENLILEEKPEEKGVG